MENQENAIPQVSTNDYRKKALPTKPQKIIDYYSAPIETKRKMNEQPEDFKSFWLDPIVYNYFESVHNVKNTNWSMLKFLKENRDERIAKGFLVDKIEAIIAEYEPEDHFINAEIKPKNQYNQSYPPIIERVAKQFGGKIVSRNDWNN